MHIEYVDCFYIQSLRLNTAVEIFLAIVSNGSIAGWVIWSQAQLVWASLIAFSHLVTAVRPYLPYQKRVKSLAALNAELELLALDTEETWYEVSRGLLTDSEIHQLVLDIRRQKQKATARYLSPYPLPYNKKYFAKAEAYAAQKIQKSYFTEE